MRALMVSSAFATLLIASSPVFAASAETDAFVANVRVNAAYLAASSTLAADRSDNAGLRDFAAKEAPDQRVVLDDLDRRAVPDAAPMNVASNEGADGVLTGRSAAVGDDVDLRFRQPAGTGALMPAAAITLEHLSQAKGVAFDGLFKATQINALRQLSGVYNAYAMTGDDEALRQTAKTELAATDARIAELGRL